MPTCASSFTTGTVVTLTAKADPTSTFSGWSGGGCSGTGTCAVTLNAATTVTANFTYNLWALTVTLIGNGTVTSNPPGISCGTMCNAVFSHGTIVGLTPAPGSGLSFVGWSGACTGAGTCSVTMDKMQSVGATFATAAYTLGINKGGGGTGTISSSPNGINCGATCSAPFPAGNVITLSAAPDSSSNFDGWTQPGCSGTGTCMVTMNAATTVNANFTLKAWQLSVSTSGSGSVTSMPSGISCGGACSATYANGQMVTLTPMAVNGHTFSSWSGDCTGNGSCVVLMDKARNVTANFVPITYVLQVMKSGTGASVGTVTGAGINCGTQCSASINANTTLSLSAAPGATTVFNGWTGDCMGAACNLTMSSAKNVTARFDLIELTVALTGGGQGVVNSSPAGINNCGGTGGTCSAIFSSGTVVTLTATPEPSVQSRLSFFAGWSGIAGCTMGSCPVLMNGPASATARFELRPNTAFVTLVQVTGAMGGLSGADATCNSQAMTYGLQGTYRAYLSTASSSAVSRIGVASGWVRYDNRPLANTAAEFASGNMFHPLRITPNGGDIGDSVVFTASAADGKLSGGNCTDFTVADSSVLLSGSSAGLSGLHAVWNNSFCSTMGRLYCFGIDRTASLPAPTPPATKRYAFVTNAPWSPNATGISSADTLCQQEATAASLPGSYLALLATTTQSAANRFSSGNGTPQWVRRDGVPLAPTAAAFFTSPLARMDTAPNLNAAGTAYFGNVSTWAGAGSFTSVAGSSNCSDWTSPLSVNGGQGGRAGFTMNNLFFGAFTYSCGDTNVHLTCLQQ